LTGLWARRFGQGTVETIRTESPKGALLRLVE
jgi:hypothetical protein